MPKRTHHRMRARDWEDIARHSRVRRVVGLRRGQHGEFLHRVSAWTTDRPKTGRFSHTYLVAVYPEAKHPIWLELGRRRTAATAGDRQPKAKAPLVLESVTI